MPREPAAFLNRIVRNLVVDRARRLTARGPEVALTNTNGPRVEARQSEAIELEQARALYQASVCALPIRTREVFLLHRVDSFAYKDILLSEFNLPVLGDGFLATSREQKFNHLGYDASHLPSSRTISR